MPTPQADAFFGRTVALGDVNGDGNADTIVGAPAENVGASGQAGRIYIFDGVSGTLVRTVDSPQPRVGDLFGFSLTLGHFDADTNIDIVAGAIGSGILASDVGRVYAISGVDGALLRTFNSPSLQPDASFGFSVSASDTNGDGVADVIVGAANEDVGPSDNLGRAYSVRRRLDRSHFHIRQPSTHRSMASSAVPSRSGSGR